MTNLPDTAAADDLKIAINKLYTQYWSGDISGQEFQQNILNLFTAHLAKVKAAIDASKPKEHEWTKVDSSNLNPQEDGEVRGWNSCLEEYNKAVEEAFGLKGDV